MSKTLARNNGALLALARDAYGNALSGNPERSLWYLRGLIQLAELNAKVIDTKADVRATMAFDKLNRELAEQEGWPAYDHSKVEENLKMWAERGLTLNVLPAANKDDLPEALREHLGV